MSTGILTLFGEETPPEELKAVGKSRAMPKQKVEKAEKVEKREIKPDPPKEETPAKKKEKAVKPAKAKAKAEPNKQEQKTPILEGWTADKQYYSIGEVSALFKVNTSHIRFWTNEFQLKVRTTKKGDRLYTPEQINELRVIYHLVKEKGYTIAGAKTKLKSDKKVSAESLDLKQSLLHLRNKLLSIRNQLA